MLNFVAEDYRFLTSTLNNSKTGQLVSQKWYGGGDNKWSEITDKIKSLSEGAQAQRLTCEKWFGLKSTSKKAVVLYNKESVKSGVPGVNSAKKTLNMQYNTR